MGINIEWIADPRATTFCSFCIFIVFLRSGKDIYRHWQQKNQKWNYIHMIGVMIMVPLYAILSFMSLLFSKYTVYFDLIRDSYEGIALYLCFQIYVDLLGSKQIVNGMLEAHSATIYPKFIYDFIMKYEITKKYLYEYPSFVRTDIYSACKYSIMQYLILRQFLSPLSCILYHYNLYIYGDFNFTTNAYPAILIISFVSIGIAFYFLGLFCNTLKEELCYYNPLKKFVCIKIIILFSFWQESILNFAILFGILDAGTNESRQYIIEIIHDFCMCLELIPFAFFHHQVYGYKTILDEFDKKDHGIKPQDTHNESNINNIFISIFIFIKSRKFKVIYLFTGLLFSFIYSLLGTENFHIINNGFAYINYAISVSLYIKTNNSYPITIFGEFTVMMHGIVNFMLIMYFLSCKIDEFKNMLSQMNTKNNPDVIHEHNPDIIHEHNPDIIHEHNPDIIHEHNPDIIHEHNPDVIHENNPQNTV
jgi:hypothetical protein